MRIVSYNVRYFGHALKGLASTAGAKTRISKAIASLQEPPDVVCLQEVETRSLRSGLAHRGGHPVETQLEAFMRHLRVGLRSEGITSAYEAWYFPAHSYEVGRVKLYTTGLAMLVNTQKLAVISGNHEAPHGVTHYGENTLRSAKQTRIVAHLHLEDPTGKKFHLFNTHLSLPSPFTREFWKQKIKMGHGKNQLAEAKVLAQYVEVKSKGEPFLLGGDFNSAPDSPVYRYLATEAKLRGAQEVLRQIDPKDPKGFSTAGFMKMRMHLDHLFGSGLHWHDLEGTHPFGDEQGKFHGMSDHVPLIARFDIG